MLKHYFENKKIIIVGPSPHLIGKNYGEFIESFDLVVRVNELGVITEMSKDYGSRTDISFLTLTDEALEIYAVMKKEVDFKNLKLIVHPRHEYNLNPITNLGNTKNVNEYYSSLNLDIEFIHIEEPSFEKRCEIFECFPSTGALAIFQILNYNFSELFICGFSFYTTKYRYSPKGLEYFRIPKKNQNKHNFRQSGHDTRQEVKALRSLIKNHENVSGDSFFRKIILSNSIFYYEFRRFVNYKLNLDNFKNIIKKIFRIKTYRKIINKYKSN
tara:strand:- start:3946 stop:4758 length:813 start_codon:yes stop_codon:yes gene_type:complete